MISFMYEIREGSREIVPRTWETDANKTDTFGELFERLAADEYKERSLEVLVGYKLPHRDPSQFVKVMLSQKLVLMDLQGANFVRFLIQVPKPNVEAKETNKDAFIFMMDTAKSLSLPPHKSANNSKDILFNDILNFLQLKKVGFEKSGGETGKKFVDYICRLLWYMDRHWKTLESQAIQKPSIIHQIYTTGNRNIYNDFEAKKESKPKLSQEKLKEFIDDGSEYLQTAWMNKKCWRVVFSDFEELIKKLKRYVDYLNSKNQSMKTLHKSKKEARSPLEDGMCYTLEPKTHTLPSLSQFDEQLDNLECYQPLFLNDLPGVKSLTKFARYKLFSKLSENALSVPVVYFKYSPKAGITTYHFLWKLPLQESERDDSFYARLSNEVAQNIGTYHTRAMKAEYKEHFSSLCNVKPALFRAMYSYLTGDNSSAYQKVSKEVDERINIALQNNDEDFVYDLREHNKGSSTKYSTFWDALGQILNRDLPSATQERRENTTLYLPLFISVRDLINKVVEENPGIKTPSESWVLLQFTPKDRSRHTALNYTSKFNIVYKMQSRSQHKNHPDRYYCMALFKYLRTFSVKFRDFVFFFCEDDKHLVNVGEPDEPIAALDRNRKVMVPKDAEVVAADHDYKRFKICPSVILKSDVPETMEGTFYHGQVFVAVKDAVFEKSTPLRHAVERENCMGDDIYWKEIECDYSDGGPDHNVNHYSVKIAHICHFLEKNLDMLVAAITYPGGSYVDPAERVMPLLNIAMNGVALARDKMSKEDEKRVKNYSSMDALRKICESDSDLEKELRKSVSGCQELLKDRFARVTLKGIPLKITETASEDQANSLFDKMTKIDPTLRITDTTKAQVLKHNGLVEWLNVHAVQRRYIFQLKKCKNAPLNSQISQEAKELIDLVTELPTETKEILISAIPASATCNDVWILVMAAKKKVSPEKARNIIIGNRHEPCNVCTPPRLPLKTFMELCFVPDPMPTEADDSKFKQFDDLYGAATKEIFRPSYVDNLDEANKCLLVKEKVRTTVTCVSCMKPRVVYGDSKIFKQHQEIIVRHIEVLQFSCGSPLFPELHSLYYSIVVRMMVKCEDNIEIAYFSSLKFKNVCVYCGMSENIVEKPEDLSKKFRIVYPLCATCNVEGKKHFTRLPVMSGKKRKNSK